MFLWLSSLLSPFIQLAGYSGRDISSDTISCSAERKSSWPKESRVTAPCSIDLCRSACCSACGSRSSARLVQFAHGLRAGGARKVLTVGNSVARSNDFGTTHTALSSLRRAVPGVSWSHEYGMVRGAFEPEHIFDELVLQPDRYSSFQVIIVYYLGLFSKKRGAELVQALQGLPQKPLVVLVEHCILEMFDDRCQSHGFPGKDDVGCFSGEGKAQWLKEQSLFLQFAERWDMPLVSACNAFRWLLQPACGEAAQVSNNDNVTALKKRLFGQGGSDPFHYNAQGTAVVGCLIADAVLSAARLPVPSPILTARQDRSNPHERQSRVGNLPVWMMSIHAHTLVPSFNQGWTVQHGGKEQSKVWLGAESAGAEVHFRIKPQRVRFSLALEYYMHYEQPMGLLDTELLEDDESAARSSLSPSSSAVQHRKVYNRSQVDACCSQPCVGPPNMGFYRRSVIARGLRPWRHHIVALRLANRTTTACQKLGSRFSIVSLIASAE